VSPHPVAVAPAGSRADAGRPPATGHQPPIAATCPNWRLRPLGEPTGNSRPVGYPARTQLATQPANRLPQAGRSQLSWVPHQVSWVSRRASWAPVGWPSRPTAAGGAPVGPWVGVNTNRPEREPHPPTTDHNHRPDDRDGPPPPDLHASQDQRTSHQLDDLRSPGAPGDPLALSELIASGDIDVVPGDPPVPVAVWRVADVDTGFGHHLADALTPRLAALLVGTHSRPGDTIVSIGHDAALAGAAGAGARLYRSVARPDELAGLEHTAAGTVALIVLPWPPPDQPDGMSRDGLVALFGACRRLMSPGGCTIVALAGLPPQQTFAEHSSALIPAAHQAGLGWLQHIVAITAPIVGHRITWRAAPADPAVLRAAAHLKVHLDLFVFVGRGGRHG